MLVVMTPGGGHVNNSNVDHILCFIAVLTLVVYCDTSLTSYEVFIQNRTNIVIESHRLKREDWSSVKLNTL